MFNTKIYKDNNEIIFETASDDIIKLRDVAISKDALNALKDISTNELSDYETEVSVAYGYGSGSTLSFKGKRFVLNLDEKPSINKFDVDLLEQECQIKDNGFLKKADMSKPQEEYENNPEIALEIIKRDLFELDNFTIKRSSVCMGVDQGRYSDIEVYSPLSAWKDYAYLFLRDDKIISFKVGRDDITVSEKDAEGLDHFHLDYYVNVSKYLKDVEPKDVLCHKKSTFIIKIKDNDYYQINITLHNGHIKEIVLHGQQLYTFSINNRETVPFYDTYEIAYIGQTKPYRSEKLNKMLKDYGII